MKTTVELPDELLVAAKVEAATKKLKLKEVIADALSRHLGRGQRPGKSMRDIAPVSVGRVLDFQGEEDLMEEMLDVRGHRY